jgi:hypothetical protein
MKNDVRRLTTEKHKRMHAARKAGGLCSICGRALSDSEPVYIDQVMVGMRQFVGPNAHPFPIYILAPVGDECVSAGFLEETKGRDPEPCAGCGRGIFYRKARPNRHRTLCSRRCRSQAKRRASAVVRSPRGRQERLYEAINQSDP